MSRFMGKNTAALTPYTPGEQPQSKRLIKLNTNECPYPPSPRVAKALADQQGRIYSLYPDPEARVLRKKLADCHGLPYDHVFLGNGSDEVLAFAFIAFFDRGDKVYYPDPSYGFYPVYAELCGLSGRPVPLAEDFSVRTGDYQGLDGHIVIANPNAPTGMSISREDVEKILRANPNRLIIVDEAYVDFAGDITGVPLLQRYDNLLIIGTFSKSRALAGLRLGFALSRPENIAALERIKYSFNPYNVNSATQLAGTAALEDREYTRMVLDAVKATRSRVAKHLERMGILVLPSSANFLFASHPKLTGREFYLALREKGVLIRCFDHPRTEKFVRISIGSDADMDELLRITALL